MTYKSTNRRDANEAELVAFWKMMNCVWVPMRPGQGFDGLLIDRANVHIVEVKNPAASWHLTVAECDLMSRIEAIGGKYCIIETLADAAELIGRRVE